MPFKPGQSGNPSGRPKKGAAAVSGVASSTALVSSPGNGMNAASPQVSVEGVGGEGPVGEASARPAAVGPRTGEERREGLERRLRALYRRALTVQKAAEKLLAVAEQGQQSVTCPACGSGAALKGLSPDDVKAQASAVQAAAAAGRQVKEWVELGARVSGDLKGPEVNVQIALLQSSEWIGLRGRLIAVLAPFPEARKAVVAMLGNE